MQKARIKLASTNIDKINEVCASIKDIAQKTKTKIYGPVPLPTQRLVHQVRKGPDGGGKNWLDKYEMRIHKRLIDLGVDERALRLVMRVHLPKGVNIEINLLE